MKIIIALLFGLLCLKTDAQNFQWIKSIGGTSNDRGRSIAIDIEGNVITVGSFVGTIDFDDSELNIYNLTDKGLGDIYIQKLDANGSFLWAKSFGCVCSGMSNTSFHEMGRSIAVDSAGNIYTTGYFNGQVDFDPGPGVKNISSQGGKDIFVQKLDSEGNFLWAKAIGSAFTDDDSYGIAIDNNNDIYITGEFGGTVDFDPGSGIYNLTANGAKEIFIQKLNTNGDFLWAKSMEGSSGSNSSGRSINADLFGNIYLTGLFSGTVDFNPNIGVNNLTAFGALSTDIFVQKFDVNGNFQWAKSFGGQQDDVGYSIVNDNFGDVYLVGAFEDTVDFDPGSGVFNISSNGQLDGFVQKLDSNGLFYWAKTIGGLNEDVAQSITLGNDNDIFVTGNFRYIVDFDPGPNIYNLTAVDFYTNTFIQKLNLNGDFVWAQRIGGVGHSEGHSITTNANGDIYSTGYFSNNISVDTGSWSPYTFLSNGAQDAFTQKLLGNDYASNENIEFNSAIVVFPNPSQGIFKIDSDLEVIENRIYDLSGKLILISNTNDIDLCAFTNGVYILKTTMPDKVFTRKLILKK